MEHRKPNNRVGIFIAKVCDMNSSQYIVIPMGIKNLINSKQGDLVEISICKARI